MVKVYKVMVHFDGAFEVAVTAENEAKAAAMINWSIDRGVPDKYILDNIAEVKVCEVKEVSFADVLKV